MSGQKTWVCGICKAEWKGDEESDCPACSSFAAPTLLGCCWVCRKPHPQSIPCDNVTQPCNQCGKPLKHIEQWQAPRRPSPLCADCYMHPNEKGER